MESPAQQNVNRLSLLPRRLFAVITLAISGVLVLWFLVLWPHSAPTMPGYHKLILTSAPTIITLIGIAARLLLASDEILLPILFFYLAAVGGAVYYSPVLNSLLIPHPSDSSIHTTTKLAGITVILLLSELMYYHVVNAILRAAGQTITAYEAFHVKLWKGAFVYNLLKHSIMGLGTLINRISGAPQTNQTSTGTGEQEATNDNVSGLPPPYWISMQGANQEYKITKGNDNDQQSG